MVNRSTFLLQFIPRCLTKIIRIFYNRLYYQSMVAVMCHSYWYQFLMDYAISGQLVLITSTE